MVDGVIFDRGGGRAGLDEIRPRRDGGGAFSPRIAGGALKRDFKLRVGQRLFRAQLECVGGIDGLAHASSSPIAAPRHARQDFGGVENADFRPLAIELARHVHQAAEIAAEQHIGAAGHDIGRLVADDGVGNLRIFDAEGSAETAAGFIAFERRQLQSFDRGEQGARLRLDAQLAQAGTGIVVGRAGLEGDVLRLEPAHIDEEAQQLECLRGEVFGAVAPVRITGEKLGILHLDHGGAGAGGRDEIIVTFESLDGLAGDDARRVVGAAVIGRLAAAGLLLGNFDRAAGGLKQGDRRETDIRPHRIDHAGHKQADARPRAFHKRIPLR